MAARDRKAFIEHLVAEGRLETAIDDLRSALGDTAAADVLSELLQHQATLRRSNIARRRGLIDYDADERARTHVGYAILDILNSANVSCSDVSLIAPTDRTESADISPTNPSVFVSYSSSDRKVAERVKLHLTT